MTEHNTTSTSDLTSEETYLIHLITPIIKNYFEAKIERKVDEKGVLLTLTVHPDDMGRVIGKGGETARSIRHLLRQMGMQNQAHVALKINEPVK